MVLLKESFCFTQIDILSTNKSVYGYLALGGELNLEFQWGSCSVNTKAKIGSNDGEKFAYLSNVGKDFISQTDLHIYTLDGGNNDIIAENVFSAPSWSSSDEKIYYTKKSKVDNKGSRWFDLYVYSFLIFVFLYSITLILSLLFCHTFSFLFLAL